MTDLDEYGAVAAVSHVQNPIKLARKILENGRVMQKSGLIPPLMLSGSGAFEYARRNQISIIENSSELISEKTLQLFEKYSSLCGTIVASNDDLLHDTVGCVAFDGEMMVSGVSSGGIWLKQQGRVGEAAVYGAGCWSEKASSNKIHVGCSVSGTGEQIIRTSLAERLCRAVISHAQTGDCNLAECLKREMTVGFLQSPKLRMYGDSLWAGFVMLVSVMNDSDGSVELWYGHTTETMAIAYHSTSDNKQPKFILSRKPKDRQLTLAGIPLI